MSTGVRNYESIRARISQLACDPPIMSSERLRAGKAWPSLNQNVLREARVFPECEPLYYITHVFKIPSVQSI